MTNVPVVLASAFVTAAAYLATTAENVVEAIPFAATGGAMAVGIAYYLFREIRTNARIDDHFERIERESAEDRERAQRAERLAFVYLSQLVKAGIEPAEYPVEAAAPGTTRPDDVDSDS